MDFGAAKPLNITSNTMQGMIVGTFHYMSPEQIAGETLDMRSDFFSLGIVLYELITGKKPFAADNLTVLIERIKSGKYERIRQIRPSISPLTEEMIDRLLARDRDHRPSSTDELKEALQHCIQSYESWGTSKKVRIPFSIRRHFGLIAVILSVVSLGLSLVAFGRTLFLEASPPQFNESASIPLLEKGRMLEWKQRWDEAINTYKMVPSLEKGGLANEYLEARIRMGAILLNHQSEYSKARKVFESLKKQYSDPAIDAYLGQCYFNLALYREAQERFESALKSTAGSVLPQSDDTKKEILYYSAYSIDKRNSGEERNEALKIEAIKAWDYYIEFAKCPKKGANPKCVFARKRRGLLESDTIDTK
jgi:serine/threonine protein kinase